MFRQVKMIAPLMMLQFRIVEKYRRVQMMELQIFSKMVICMLIGRLILTTTLMSSLGGRVLYCQSRHLVTNILRNKTIRWLLRSIERLCGIWMSAGKRRGSMKTRVCI
nr:hypothetical protein LSAT_3X64020 [Ipomoea batatas]